MTTNTCISLACCPLLHYMFIIAESITFVCIPYLLLALLCLCLVFVVFTRSPLPPAKRRRVVLTMKKCDIIKKMEVDWTLPALP